MNPAYIDRGDLQIFVTAGEDPQPIPDARVRITDPENGRILEEAVTDASGRVWPGLGLADFTTVETEKRTPVDVVATPTLWEAPAVGFMNKCSLTHGVATPLFSALSLGFGNEAEHGPEGYVSGNVFATHLTGPVLVKNPDFLDVLVRRVFQCKGWTCPDQLPDIPYQREAYAVTLRELRAPGK